MRQLAHDLYLLRGFPPNVLNVYLAGDVLVDAGSRHDERRILRQVEGRGVLAAQVLKPQARVLAASRGIACVEVDLAVLRGEREPDLTLFAA